MTGVAVPGAGVQGTTLRRRVDAAIERTYRRWGRNYLWLLFWITLGLVLLVTTPLQNLSQIALLTGSYDRSWYLVFFLVPVVGTPLVLLPVMLGRHGAVLRFLRGEPYDPVEVWRASVTKLPLSAVLVTVPGAVMLATSGIWNIGRREDFDAGLYVGAAAAQAMITFGTGAFYFMLYELALLPVARAVAPLLPADFAERAWLTIRRRLVLLITALTLTIGGQVAGFSSGFSQRDARIWAVVVITVGLVLTYVGLSLALVGFSITRRIDELAGALQQVGQGEVPQRVHPAAGDEFDGVGRAFNAMVDLLEEHERELRASRARVVAVADEARRGMERDLHDGAQQHLALLSMQLGRLERRSADRPELAARVATLRAELAEVVTEMRVLAHGIYPVALEHEGILMALRGGATQARIPLALHAEGVTPWPRDVATAVYFCCWEFIQRAHRARTGAEDGAVAISLRQAQDTVHFTLAGPASPAAADTADLVQYLQDRLGAVGGTVTADPDASTMLVVHGRVMLW